MRKFTVAILTLVALISGLSIISCGETDPALAPAGAAITIISNQSVEWSYSCYDQSKLPVPCFETWRSYIVSYCVANPTTQVVQCAQNETSLEYCCDNQNFWTDYLDNQTLLDQAQIDIELTTGACGYFNTIVSAFVTLGGTTSAGAAGGTGEVGGQLEGQPMNDVRVRFIAQGGQMYLLSDDPATVAALPNPYLTETDDRGKAEVKYRTPLPTYCDSLTTYVLSADVGVSQAQMTVNYTVTAAEEESTAE